MNPLHRAHELTNLHVNIQLYPDFPEVVREVEDVEKEDESLERKSVQQR